MSTAYISHSECILHDMGAGHPESPDRLGAIKDRLIAAGLDLFMSFYDAPLATDEQILRAHPAEYLKYLMDNQPLQGIRHLDPDTAMNPYTLQAARRSAGAGVLATELVLNGEMENAFCAVRPPGHHAEKNKAMGFCFFNNIAIAALYAMEQFALQRVAIVDFDVHHGNGTENIFSGDERVLMVGIFQHPFYPYSGADNPASNMVNVPLKAGTKGDVFRDAVTAHWLPALQQFKPEMIFISAGFDAHYEDDMGSLGLVESDYAWVTEALLKVAAQNGHQRIVSMLEGGYTLSPTARSAVAHIKALTGL